MMTCQRDPTQEREHKNKLGSFTAGVMDDNDEMFNVKIEYEYTPYFYGGISVWSFDYAPIGKPSMSDHDLCNAVKDLIREENNNEVSFY